jgi:hypothetical protein
MMNPSATLRIEADSDLLQILIELSRLRVLGRRIQATRRYLASPGSNIQMGHACLSQTVTKLRAMLVHLCQTDAACRSDQPMYSKGIERSVPSNVISPNAPGGAPHEGRSTTH